MRGTNVARLRISVWFVGNPEVTQMGSVRSVPGSRLLGSDTNMAYHLLGAGVTATDLCKGFVAGSSDWNDAHGAELRPGRTAQGLRRPPFAA